jgi:UDP-GlcNAc:undecaprenyl-phosphate GlcNAc-1-phosphate transferase
VALRIISHHHRHQAGWIAFLIVLALVCAAASVYLIYVLEIFKFKGMRTIELRRADPTTTEHEIEDRVTRDIETGEFEKVQ